MSEPLDHDDLRTFVAGTLRGFWSALFGEYNDSITPEDFKALQDMMTEILGPPLSEEETERIATIWEKRYNL